MVLRYEEESISAESVNISFFKDKNLLCTVDSFYTSEDVLGRKLSFELVENIPVSISFQSSDKSARFYMYGLESLSDENLESDEEGNVYLKPSSTQIALYGKDYYPLIPGTYLAKLLVEGNSYYVPFSIKPKQVTEEQLLSIKKDLEGTIKGLAIDFVKKVYSPGESEIKALPPKILKQFMTIKKHYPSVMAALTDIYEKANYRIRKVYRWTSEERAKQIDHVTVRAQHTRSLHDGHLLTPYNAIDYDLPENRWVKFIIRNVLSLLEQFLESLDLYKEWIIRELEELHVFEFQERTRREIHEKERVKLLLEDYRQFVNRMKIGLQMVIHAPWYQEVTNKTFTHVPHNLLSDSRYRALFQLHRDLMQEELEVFIDPVFTYQWKRTDKLYEMWGYIQILRLLLEIEFQPLSGWIYSHSFVNEKILIPHLPSGERIVLSNGDIRIHYIYDGVLPIASIGTSLEDAPLYMGKNNRPDGRLDFYKDEVYVGTLIIEFKYRPIHNIWKNSVYNSMSRPKEMDQLIAYKRDSNSTYLYGEQKRNIRELLSPRPVQEVWAFYAESNKEKQKHFFLHDDSIRIMPMNPDEDNKSIKEELQKIINRMVLRAEIVINSDSFETVT